MAGDLKRLRVEIRGAVQGVGFRPFVYRLATELGLAGWVLNDSRGVDLEVEGRRQTLEIFLGRLSAEAPPRALVQSLEPTWLEPAGFERFAIEHSDASGEKSVFVLPDIATCDDCLAEVLDADDRRHAYPFTNCTNCGPRFTIVRALPYDRPNTTMAGFPLCPDCRREYKDPLDRRFHAQPNACPACGPRIALWDAAGEVLAAGAEALSTDVLETTARALADGEIVAAKGLGGFHLVVDARSAEAVARLRERKRRLEKPLALMVADLAAAGALVDVPGAAAELLTSPEAPIVLLRRRDEANVAPGVAPGSPDLGVMLPPTPLHHLLLRATGFPVVATSGNLSDEPIATDEGDAVKRLGGIADRFLVNDRPIARHADDSVVRLLRGAPQIVRRARGSAPLPITLPGPVPTMLAVGGHLKNVVALARGDQAFLSQHIGDMETPRARAAFERVVRDFLDLYDAEPVILVHDLHPDYPTTRWARRAVAGEGAPWTSALHGVELVGVQHHHAHLASCLAENGASGPALGIVWDGTGYGNDGTIWGGEYLRGDAAGFERVAHLRPFRLPGGDAAAREPRRVALALLLELWGNAVLERDDLAPVRAFTPAERRLIARMLERGVNAPVTTSAGRLFDAVAALLDLHQATSLEGQAAMAVEQVAADVATDVADAYPFPLRPAEPARFELDWEPLIAAIVDDLGRGVDVGRIAGRFHGALIATSLAVAREIGEKRIVLSGGCFLNRRLSVGLMERLEGDGFEVLVQRRVPPGDGGLALGQIVVAAARSPSST